MRLWTVKCREENNLRKSVLLRYCGMFPNGQDIAYVPDTQETLFNEADHKWEPAGDKLNGNGGT
jgi:hypothetical protein